MADGKGPGIGIGKDQDQAPPKGAKERLYDKVKLPLWAVDLIIGVLVVVLIAVVIIGTR